MSTLTFWQNIPAIIQAPLLREVADRFSGTVTVVLEEGLPQRRREQGWSMPDYGAAQLVIAPDREERRALVSDRSTSDDVHIFTGFHAFPETYWTLRQASKYPVRIGVFSEPGATHDGMKGWLRRQRYRLHGLRWGRRIDFLLATGALGVQWFKRCLFPANKIIPFGYFVDADTSDETSQISQEAGEELHILFVGQLIHRKGIDVLLDAISRLPRDMSWRLNLVGTGSEEAEFRSLAKELSVQDRVKWLGMRPNAEVRTLMREADLFVLPSRFDGWGAVVNEALHEGTPVVTTTTCGASDLIQEAHRGATVPPEDAAGLAHALERQLRRGKLPPKHRTQLQAWAEETISPQAAAVYLREVLEWVEQDGSTPCPPWRSTPISHVQTTPS